VDDAVAALLLAAISDASNGQVFFAVGDRQYTVAEIAEAIARHIGGRVRFVPWPKDRETIEIGDAVICNAKAKSTLGWFPEIDLDRGLPKTRDYFMSRLQYYLA